MVKQYDYLILGGGIAGVTAAETIRENDPHSSVAIVSGEEHPLYSRVLLPAYLKKRIPRDKLFLRRIDDFSKKEINLYLADEAAWLDTKRKEVGLTSSNVLGFHKLLISTGGKVKPWEIGIKDEHIYRLQTLDDADRLFGVLDDFRQPLVVGASFISLEFLEIFTLNKISPILLVRDAYFFSKIFDPHGGELMRANFEKSGITMQFSDTAKEATVREGIIRVETDALREIKCDAIALGIGLQRNVGFLEGSGLELGGKGVRTNEFLETSVEGVFAAGDVAEFYDVISSKYRLIGNWTNAFLQGKRVGLNMLGQREPFRNVSAYSITNLGWQLTALGDFEEPDETVVRLDEKRHQYERFFLRNGVMVGVSLINRFQDKPHLAKLIETKAPIASYRDELKDFRFDIHTIPVVF